MRWAGEPVRCPCTRITVRTLAETLYCPNAWLEIPGGWVHTRWIRVVTP